MRDIHHVEPRARNAWTIGDRSVVTDLLRALDDLQLLSVALGPGFSDLEMVVVSRFRLEMDDRENRTLALLVLFRHVPILPRLDC